MFLDRTAPPDADALARALGPARKHWDAIAAHVAARCPEARTEWKFSGASTGWSFRIKDARRNLIYMLPGNKAFRVSLVFGDRAAADVEASDLPDAIRRELREARRYAEGRGLRLEVATARDAAIARKLADIKLGRA